MTNLSGKKHSKRYSNLSTKAWHRGICGGAMAALLLGLAPGSLWAAPATPTPGENVEEMQGQKETELENTVPDTTGRQESAYFHVKKITVEAPDMKLRQSRLDKLAAKYEGKDTNLTELNGLLDELARYCRRHNYPAATAYIPSQDMDDGLLKVAIMPGRLGKVTIENNSKLKESAVERQVRGLHEGDIITSRSLETALYNLNGLEGADSAGVLSPGAEVGTSDLTIKVKDGKKSRTTLYVENYGNKNTGRYRYGLQENLSNLGGQGDQLRLGVLLSNKDLRNYYLGYEAQVGTRGTKLGIGISHMDYEVGAALQAFGAEGKADTISLYGSTPLWRTAYSSMAVTYGYDYRKLKDEYSRIPIADFERESHAAHVGLEGTERFPASALQYSVTATAGSVHKKKDNIGIGRPSGGFAKGNVDLTYLQELGGPFDMVLKAQGQIASKNLDSSEQMYLGGARGIRAYQQGEASGDNGLLGSLEFRYHTPVKGLMLSAYLDAGHVSQKGSGQSTTLKGWGLGLTYSRPDDWFARFDYARRIGLPDTLQNVTESQAKQRMWFMVGKIF